MLLLGSSYKASKAQGIRNPFVMSPSDYSRSGFCTCWGSFHIILYSLLTACIPALLASPVTLISIAQNPPQVPLRDAAVAGKSLQTSLLATATSLHLNPNPIHTTHLADIVCGQDCILPCIDATAMLWVNLFTGCTAVLL